MAIFTLKELEGLQKRKIIRIATYLKLDVSQKARKREIIDAILLATSIPSVEEAEPQMSVRVRRIKGV